MPSLLLLAATCTLALARPQAPYSSFPYRPFTAFTRRPLSGPSSSFATFKLGDALINEESNFKLNSADDSEPTAKAALNFIEAMDKKDICGLSSEAYLRVVTSGGDALEATKEARKAYLKAWRSGVRAAPNSPCAAAEAAFKSNFDSRSDAILPAALAYMNSFDPTPCGEAGKAYIKTVTGGQSPRVAALYAARAFLDAVAEYGNQKDTACISGQTGFVAASGLGGGDITKAMETFVSSFDGGADPVCLAAGSAYIDAKIASQSDDDAFAAAGKAYLSAIKTNPSGGKACLAAQAIFTPPAPAKPVVQAKAKNNLSPYTLAAVNFLETVESQDICGLSSQAYLRAITQGGSAAEANSAAAQAYRKAHAAGLRATPNSACAASEAAFKDNFSAGREAILPAALAYIRASEANPCGEAGKAYIKAIKNSEPIERASLFAAKAYISAAATYSSAPDNSCIAAKDGFVTATGKGNEEVVKGMEAFMSAYSGGVDAVCSASSEAYIDAKIAKKSDEDAFADATAAYIAALRTNPGQGQACIAAAGAFLGN